MMGRTEPSSSQTSGGRGKWLYSSSSQRRPSSLNKGLNHTTKYMSKEAGPSSSFAEVLKEHAL